MTVLASDGDILASAGSVLASGYDGGFIMALASGTKVSLSYQAEPTTQGVPDPTPDMKALRATGRNINPQINTLRSQEVRQDRQVAGLRHGFNQIVGSPGFELSLEAFDDMIEAAVSGTWAAKTTGTQTISLIGGSTTALIQGTGTTFVSDGFRVGDVIEFPTGWAETHPLSVITSLTETNMGCKALDGSNYVNDTAASGDEVIAIPGNEVKIGDTLRTFTFERAFNDVNQYQVFNGVAVNEMSIDIQPEAIINGTLNLLGMSFNPLTGTPRDASVTAAATNEPMASFEGVIFTDGNLQAVVTGLSFTINNGRSLNPVVGSKFSPAVFEGTATITGEITAYFEDETLLNDFINEETVTLTATAFDINGTDFIHFNMPAIKYTGGDMDPPQQGPVPLRLPFEAQVHATNGESFVVQRSNT